MYSRGGGAPNCMIFTSPDSILKRDTRPKDWRRTFGDTSVQDCLTPQQQRPSAPIFRRRMLHHLQLRVRQGVLAEATVHQGGRALVEGSTFEEPCPPSEEPRFPSTRFFFSGAETRPLFVETRPEFVPSSFSPCCTHQAITLFRKT